MIGLWMLMVIDGIWTYATVKALGSRAIPISPFFFLGLIIVAAQALLSGRKFVPGTGTMVATAWVFCAYLLAVTMVHQHIDDGSIAVLWRGYYLNYFYILLLPFCGFLTGRLSPTIAAKIIVITAIGLGIFGTIQHFSNDLFAVGRLISIESGAFNLGFSGKTRANGLFAHSEDLGFFLSLAAAMITAYIAKEKNTIRRALLLLILIILAVGCYSTLTRSAYVAFVFSCMVALFISIKKEKITWGINAIPFVLLSLSLLIFFARAILSSIVPDLVIFSSSSLDDRIAGTSYYLRQLTSHGSMDLFFGKGWYFLSNPHATIPLDNGYAGILLNTGIIGLILWIYLTFQIWKFIAKKSIELNHPSLIGMAAFYSCWLGLSVFGVVNLFQFVAMAFFLSMPALRRT